MVALVALGRRRREIAAQRGHAPPADGVHSGAVCEGGASCTTGRQLFDDFGVDTDSGR